MECLVVRETSGLPRYEVPRLTQSTRPSVVVSPSAWSPILSSPLQYLLSGSVWSGWRLVQPLLLTLERDEDGCYIASDDQFAVYGDGGTLAEALQDYIVSLIEYYEILAARADDDLPTQALFRRLRLYLNPPPS
jgi:hypothetical protein